MQLKTAAGRLGAEGKVPSHKEWSTAQKGKAEVEERRKVWIEATSRGQSFCPGNASLHVHAQFLTDQWQSSRLHTSTDPMHKPFPHRAVLEELKRRIEHRFPQELVRLMVFGSQARGETTLDSDIDVLIVVRSQDWQLGDAVRDLGYELEISHGLILSIQVMSQRQYEERSALGSSFLKNVEREGLAV